MRIASTVVTPDLDGVLLGGSDSADWVSERDELATRDELIESCIPMVYAFAKRLTPGESWLEYRDFVGEGFVGLTQAAHSYDPSKGASFSTFAAARVRGAMLDALRSSMPLPRRVAQNLRKLNQATDELTTDLGRSPSDEEIAEKLETDAAHLKDTRAWTGFRLLSLNDSRSGESEIDVPDETDVEADFLRTFASDALRGYIARLMPRERGIIHGIFFEYESQRTLTERYNISESRVSQIRRRALQSLKVMMERDADLAAA